LGNLRQLEGGNFGGGLLHFCVCQGVDFGESTFLAKCLVPQGNSRDFGGIRLAKESALDSLGRKST
jgi:hypothetical protein